MDIQMNLVLLLEILICLVLISVFIEFNTVKRPPLESYLNWIDDLAPTPPRKDNQENLPPSAEPLKLPRKMRPRRQQKHHHHHHLGATGSTSGVVVKIAAGLSRSKGPFSWPLVRLEPASHPDERGVPQ